MAEDWNQEQRNELAAEIEQEAGRQLKALLKGTDEMSVRDKAVVLRVVPFFTKYLRGDVKGEGDDEDKLGDELRELRAADRAKLSGLRPGEVKDSGGS